MNKVLLCGRLTATPEIRYSANNNQAVAHYTIACDRRFKRDGEQSADFIRCVAFGKSAEFAENYLNKGTKIIVEGRIQTGSYTGKDGKKVYTTEVVVESQEFAESKSANQQYQQNQQQNQNQQAQVPPQPQKADNDGFMQVPDAIDEDLPFN